MQAPYSTLQGQKEKGLYKGYTSKIRALPYMKDSIVKKVSKVKGIRFHNFLNNNQKAIIAHMEEKNNQAVMECLKKPFVCVITHDEHFRKPLAPLILAHGEGYLFPPQKFPELHPKALCSSPSRKVHEFLVHELKLFIDENEATMLVGL